MCVVEGYNGLVCGFFSSVDHGIKDHIPLIRTTIAAQLYYFLIKRGCTGESIKRMFNKVFTMDQNRKVTGSKFSKKTGMAVVKEEEGDDIIRAAQLMSIDTSLGRMASQRKESRDNKEFDASQIAFGIWRRVNKFTLSSMSGIHYGHYKAATLDKFSTKLLAQQLTIIA